MTNVIIYVSPTLGDFFPRRTYFLCADYLALDFYSRHADWILFPSVPGGSDTPQVTSETCFLFSPFLSTCWAQVGPPFLFPKVSADFACDAPFGSFNEQPLLSLLPIPPIQFPMRDFATTMTPPRHHNFSAVSLPRYLTFFPQRWKDPFYTRFA